MFSVTELKDKSASVEYRSELGGQMSRFKKEGMQGE